MKDGPMRTKLHKVILSALLAGSVSLVIAPAAQANRGGGGGGGGGGYVPTENTNVPPVIIPVDLTGTPIVPQVDGSGNGGDPGESVPEVNGISIESPEAAPVVDPGTQDTKADPAPTSGGGVFGGVLSRTGSETLPLARAGLAAFTLGAGMVMLGRRRRQGEAAA